MIFEAIKPLTGVTDQLIDVVLSNNPYTLRILWNERFGYWSLSIYERDGAVIVENIKMVKDYPLVGQYKDTRLPVGDLYFIDPKSRSTRPDYDAFTDYVLAYYVPDEIATVGASTQVTNVLSGSIWDGGLSSWDNGASTWDA